MRTTSFSLLSRKQVIGIIAFLVIARIVGFALLKTDRTASLFSHFFEVGVNLLAIGCCLTAVKRGKGVYRLFWLLFTMAFSLQLVADAGWAYSIYFKITVPEAALFPSLFYRLYAGPMALALFLSEDARRSKLENILDGCIVLGLVGLCMYELQIAELQPHDPNMGQLITTTAVVNGILVLVATARFVFSTPGPLHRLYGRLATYLAVYSSIAFATSYVDTFHPKIDDAFDMIWMMTYLTAGALAIRWDPGAGVEDKAAMSRISKRTALFSFNLAMAVMVLGSAILGLKAAGSSRVIGLIAVGVVLLSYAVRCTLMQDAQEKYVSALKESNTRYECVSLATNDVLWDRDLNDNTVTWNNNVCSLFGYDPSSLSNSRRWWIENVHPDDRERLLTELHAFLESGNTSRSWEYRFRRANGSYAFVLDRSYVIRDTQGKPLRMIGSIQDLTVRKQAELAIEQARQAAEAAAAAKSDFLSNMSHEIRTPLNGIMGMLELTQQTKLSPEQEELLAIAGESAQSLLSVVNDVLDFSKIEAGKIELEQAEFDLPDTVAEAARTVLLSAHKKKLDLKYRVAKDVPQHIIGDSARLKQVLVNLLGNAVKFTDNGQVLLQVETKTADSEEVCLRFSVSDTGIGISPEKQEAIFQAFSQADNSITRKFGGTGLGLTISSNLVKLMKGNIWVESTVGKGSTFFFTATFEAGKPVDAATTRERQLRVQGVRALVLDPHPTSRSFLQDNLTSWGVEVLSVSTVAEAREALASPDKRFNLLLLDNDLPEAGGLALVAHLKDIDGRLPATLVMLSADNYQEIVHRCHELGVTGHLIKPFKPSELLAVIEKVSAQRNNQPEAEVISTLETQRSRRLNILLAEDNVVNQKVAARLLEKLGHQVEVVDNGRLALEKAKSESFDLIFMDGHMPEMDGLAATRAIRDYERLVNKHIPIIAMTAMAMEGDEQACLQAGMDAFIPKPVSFKALQETIQRVTDGSNHLPSPPAPYSPNLSTFRDFGLR